MQLLPWKPEDMSLEILQSIQYFKVYDAEGNPLISENNKRLGKPHNISEVIVKYNYYTNELNAGSAPRRQQLYVNPVNLS